MTAPSSTPNNSGQKWTDQPQVELPLTGAEIMLVVQSGISRQMTVADFLGVGGSGVVLYTAAAGVSHNVAPVGFGLTTRFLLVDTNAGAAQFTGLVAGVHNQRIIILNRGPNALRLDALNVGSTAPNQFWEAVNLALLTNMATELVYINSGGFAKWIVIP